MNKKIIVGLVVGVTIFILLYNFLSVGDKKVYDNEYQPKPEISESNEAVKQPGYRESLYDTVWPVDFGSNEPGEETGLFHRIYVKEQ